MNFCDCVRCLVTTQSACRDPISIRSIGAGNEVCLFNPCLVVLSCIATLASMLAGIYPELFQLKLSSNVGGQFFVSGSIFRKRIHRMGLINFIGRMCVFYPNISVPNFHLSSIVYRLSSSMSFCLFVCPLDVVSLLAWPRNRSRPKPLMSLGECLTKN